MLSKNMKKIYKDTILNIPNTNVFDRTFVFDYFLEYSAPKDITLIYLRDILWDTKNEDILPRIQEKSAMWSEVYSPKDELRIFQQVFEEAIAKKQRIHVVWVTLQEEIQLLEEYYTQLGFLRKDINAFDIDFSVPLVTVSCYIENLMWKWSDYKRMGKKIFFCPPIRSSSHNKALFKGITRGVIAGIDMNQNTNGSDILEDMPVDYNQFLWDCIRTEKILPLHMGKILKYNLEDMWCMWKIKQLQISY